MKRVDLDKLETELEKWRGAVSLPCEVVVSMIAELRGYRSTRTRRSPLPSPQQQPHPAADEKEAEAEADGHASHPGKP